MGTLAVWFGAQNTQVHKDAMRLSKLLRHSLSRNILALYGVHFATYLLPLITVPYLAQVLGPTAWGLVAFAQAFGQYIILLVEYGFGLSATREVARSRDNQDKLADILAGVLGAQGLLAFLAIILVLLVRLWVPAFQDQPILLWASLFWALSNSFNSMWYYQGLEQMRLVAALNISARFLGTVGIFLLVHSSEDGWKVLLSQGMGNLFSTAVVLVMVYHEVPFRLPTGSLVWEALQKGWTMFLFQSSASLYTTGNTFILGLFAPPQLVGYYAGAEKISKAFVGLLRPVSQALYPRLSYLVQNSRAKAVQLARIGLIVMGVSGGLLGFLFFLLAPLLVRVLLGEEFAPAVPVLQALAWLPLLIALSNVLGIQWMLPLGLDRPFNIIVIGGGLLNLILALVLAPHYAHLGMAWAVVASELFVTGGIYTVLRQQGLDPLTYASKKQDIQ